MITSGDAPAIAYDIGPTSGALAVPVPSLRERVWLSAAADIEAPSKRARAIDFRSMPILMEALPEATQLWSEDNTLPESGIGGSIAFAVAARRAVAAWTGVPVDSDELSEFARRFETSVTGHPNSHAVAACVHERPMLCIDAFRPIVEEIPMSLGAIALAIPAMKLPRSKWRKAWPQKVHARRLATNNGLLAEWILRLTGAWRTTGVEREDGIVERATSSLVPGYHPVRKAALDAGATLVGMSASGPAVAALCFDQTTALDAARAMQLAFRAHSLDAFTTASPIYSEHSARPL